MKKWILASTCFALLCGCSGKDRQGLDQAIDHIKRPEPTQTAESAELVLDSTLYTAFLNQQATVTVSGQCASDLQDNPGLSQGVYTEKELREAVADLLGEEELQLRYLYTMPDIGKNELMVLNYADVAKDQSMQYYIVLRITENGLEDLLEFVGSTAYRSSANSCAHVVIREDYEIDGFETLDLRLDADGDKEEFCRAFRVTGHGVKSMLGRYVPQLLRADAPDLSEDQMFLMDVLLYDGSDIRYNVLYFSTDSTAMEKEMELLAYLEELGAYEDGFISDLIHYPLFESEWTYEEGVSLHPYTSAWGENDPNAIVNRVTLLEVPKNTEGNYEIILDEGPDTRTVQMTFPHQTWYMAVYRVEDLRVKEDGTTSFSGDLLKEIDGPFNGETFVLQLRPGETMPAYAVEFYYEKDGSSQIEVVLIGESGEDGSLYLIPAHLPE